MGERWRDTKPEVGQREEGRCHSLCMSNGMQTLSLPRGAGLRGWFAPLGKMQGSVFPVTPCGKYHSAQVKGCFPNQVIRNNMEFVDAGE